MKIVNYLKSLMLIVMALTVANMGAANVDSQAAQAKAIQFMNSQAGTRFMASTANMKLSHAEKSVAKAGAYDYYVFNMEGGGYVIVSGDDRAEEILGYGSGHMDVNNLPCNVAWWLGHYKEQLEYLIANPKLQVETPSMMSPMLRATTVPQLLTCTWDQEAPYYNQCPTSGGKHCMTGCVATAMAQVMYFWKYPNELPAVEGYNQEANSYYGVPALTLEDLPATTLDWANMIDDYSSVNYTTAQANAVAKLMRYCGQAAKMEYTPDGSGAYSEDQMAAMVKFGYNSGAEYVQKSDYNNTNWNAMMQAELEARRPILYGGNDRSAGGHAFVVDGYNASTNKYHVNFGWSGYDDNYYALDAFTGSGYTFNYYQDMIIGVYPEGSTLETYAPVLGNASNVGTTSFKASWTDQTPSENVTSYTLYVDEYNANVLLTETFAGITVSNDGTADISSSLDEYCDNAGWTGSAVYQGAGGFAKVGSSSYAGNLTTPALDLSSCGGTITVKFNGKYYNNDASSVVVSCGNVSQTVALTGTAADYTVVLTGVSATSGQKVNFANTARRKRFYLDNIEITPGNTSTTLKASETGDASHRVITGITSKNYTVNNLNAGGSYKFYVEANYTDGSTKQSETKTVTLEGTPVATPELVIDPETLTMNANVGQTATATFEVLGADLTGNVTVTLTDANGVYTINPTTITKAAAEAGATVTVTYAPTAAGTHNATITVASDGAEAVTVTLNGTATMPTTAPVMAAATNVGTTSFKATWTDATSAQYVTDYTLYVNKVTDLGDIILNEAFSGVTATNDGTARIESALDDYCDNLGWTGSYVYQAGGGGLKFGNSSNGGTLTTPALDLSNSGGVITVKLNGKNFGTDVTTLTVSCGDASQTVELTDVAEDHIVYLELGNTSAGQKVTISSNGSRQRYYLYSVQIFNGGMVKAVTETGDANSRIITGITAKTYTVEGLTPGETYEFYVVANYTDNTNAASNHEQVTLEGVVVPTPELIVDEETLTMTANVGETVTATFDVMGADLTGNVTVTLTDETGYFSINPATISIADAEEGATVTVTYAPAAAGEHTATITVASEGAEDVTVTVNGTAAMETLAPEMQPADEDYVTTTSFRADWVDVTPEQYVKDYTLYVNKVTDLGDIILNEAFGGVTATNDGTTRIEDSLDDYCDNAGWTGSYVYEAGGGGLKFGNSSNGGTLTTPALDLSNSGGVITVKLNGKNYGTDVTTLTVSCGDASQTVELTDVAEDYIVYLELANTSAGQKVTISSNGSRQRYYLYSVQIFNGGMVKAASETGDADSRVITGITDQYYVVENLTPGATYTYYVEANYIDDTKAASNVETVTLLDIPVVPTPELVVDSETLTMSVNVGETVTATFDVLGADLTGDVTVTLTDETGYFSINPATISIADAEEGATVTVTYAPTAAGEHTATITVASEGAEDLTVTVNGTAAMETLAPEMQPADEDYVTTTSFRADWVDVTPEQYVKDYTLYVNKVTDEEGLLLNETFGGVTATNDGTNRIDSSLDDYCDYAGWTGEYVYQAGGGGLKFGNSSNGGSLTTPALDFTESGGAITVVVNAKNYGTDATTLTIACGNVSKTVELTDEAEEYTVYLEIENVMPDQYVTISSTGSRQRYYLYSVQIFNGGMVKAASETGDADSRVITGITDQYYVVENLTPGATYTYYVEANYIDDTKAASNVETVTLLEEQSGDHLRGDVNHDGMVNVNDATILIDYLLGADVTICEECADFNGDTAVSVADVTALIDWLLSGK